MKPERILFLDIDGVLNDHAMCEVPNCCTIKPACMASLNRIIHESCCGLALEIRTFHWAVVDDLDLGFSACEQCGPRFVRTNGKSGLNHVSAQQIIDVFNGQIKV